MDYGYMEDKFFSELLLDNKDTFYPLELYVKPMLGREVFVVNGRGKEIYKFTVYARGKDFFVPEGALGLKEEYREIRYDEYGERWFFDLEEAKAKLYEDLADDEEIVEGEDGVWYAERCEDGTLDN